MSPEAKGCPVSTQDFDISHVSNFVRHRMELPVERPRRRSGRREKSVTSWTTWSFSTRYGAICYFWKRNFAKNSLAFRCSLISIHQQMSPSFSFRRLTTSCTRKVRFLPIRFDIWTMIQSVITLLDVNDYPSSVFLVPSYKLITPSVVSERLKIRGSLARFALIELEGKGKSSKPSRIMIYVNIKIAPCG